MKKNKTILLILASLWLTAPIKAQDSTTRLDPAVIAAFPAHIVYRIYDVTTRTDLPVDRQWMLGRYFLSQDSLAGLALKNGKPPAKLKDYYSKQTEEYVAIVTPAGINDYQTANGIFRSQSSAVLRYRKQLGLNEEQVSRVVRLWQSWGDRNMNDDPDMKKKDALELNQILTPAQFEGSLAIINKRKAHSYVLIDLERAREYKLLDGPDSAQLIKQIEAYRLHYTADVERTTICDHPESAADSLKKKDDAWQPPVLFKLMALRNAAPSSELSLILRYESAIKLQSRQKDSIVSRMQSLEQTRYASWLKGEKYNSKTFETETITQLLDSTQREVFWTEKNRDKAAVNTDQDLANLQEANLIADNDQDRIRAEINQYELDLLTSQERINYQRTPGNLLLRKAVQYNKPDALKKLDQLKKVADTQDDAKKSFTW
jgi:hypothetical protein